MQINIEIFTTPKSFNNNNIFYLFSSPSTEEILKEIKST